MTTTKYLILDVIENPAHNLSKNHPAYSENRHTLKPRIVSGFFSENIIETLNIQQKWVPKPEDKIYFFSGCTVPRFKVRDKYVCTIKLDKATVAFINPNSVNIVNDLVIQHPVLPLTDEETHSVLHEFNDSPVKLLIYSLMKANNIETVCISKHFVDAFRWNTDFLDKNLTKILDTRHLYNMNFNLPKYQLWQVPHNSQLTNSSCPIYLQDEILGDLNKGQLIINLEKYREFQALGRSNDRANILLMMELMANSDFKASILFLFALLKEFRTKIIDMTEVDHVNFKSLLSFCNLDKKQLRRRDSLSIHHMSNILKQHKLFTKENAMFLIQLSSNDHFDEDDSENKYWTTGVILKPEVINELDD